MKSISPLALLVLVVALPLAGCENRNRRPVEGTVTFAGKGIEKGYIQFRPIEGARGPTAGAEIAEGRYRIAESQGLPAGKYRVEITASKKTGRTLPNDFGGGTAPVFEQYLPARFNSASELTAEIRDEPTNKRDFELSAP
jgi:hypothetical protein